MTKPIALKECRCGHILGEHDWGLKARRAGEASCLVVECHCENFVDVTTKKVPQEHIHKDCIAFVAKQFMSKEECEECQVHTAMRIRAEALKEVGESLSQNIKSSSSYHNAVCRELIFIKALKKGEMPE